MEFWIQQDNDQSLQLPVKPTDFNVTVAHRNTVVNVIQQGDINLMGKSGLREIPLSSFFPSKPYNFSRGYVRDPMSCVNLIEKWRNSGKPIRVIITGLLNMEATIESFTWGERDATGDIYYTLNLKEYKKVTTKKATVKIEVVKDTTRETKPASSSSGKTYVVKAGDCLWNIAKRFYGNGALYTKIYNANKGIIKNPNLIYTGQVLLIE